MNEVKPIVELEGCMMGFAALNPSYTPRLKNLRSSPHLSAKNANHGGNVTIARPQIKQTAKKYSRQIREMAPLCGIS